MRTDGRAERGRGGAGLLESAASADERDLELALRAPEEETRREAASRLLSRYQDHVFAWCLRYAGERERALDLAQDVLLAAYRGLNRFSPRAKFSTWLFVITRNRCISETRRVSVREVLGFDPDLVPGRDPGPDTALEEKEGRERLLRLIREHLDPREQEAVYLRCFERMPVDGITRVLEITEASGARGVLQNARRKLRSALARKEGEDG